MKFTIGNMNEDLAKQILSWKYESPYDFYNNDINEEGIREKLNGSYQVVYDEDGEVFGFFCTGEAARVPIGYQYGVYQDHLTDVGLGMHPDYVGKGYGYDFCSYIVDYIHEKYKGIPMRLTVATFNNRAIRLYEKLGFEKKDSFSTHTTEFITMIKKESFLS